MLWLHSCPDHRYNKLSRGSPSQQYGACCCSSDALTRRQQAVTQGDPQAPPSGVGAMSAQDSGCESPTRGGTRTRLPAPFRPAWTQQMLRLLTGMLGSRPWLRSASSLPHATTLLHPSSHPLPLLRAYLCAASSSPCTQCNTQHGRHFRGGGHQRL